MVCYSYRTSTSYFFLRRALDTPYRPSFDPEYTLVLLSSNNLNYHVTRIFYDGFGTTVEPR